jgi:SAM-dependent methyltransferase
MALPQSIRHRARTWLEWSSLGFRLSLRLRHGATGPHGRPEARWHNAVLKSRREASNAVEQVRKLGLPLVQDAPKNWDSLAALDLILRNTDPAARIFDAGGERYSMILPWLFLYGYRNLTVGNIVFGKPFKKGPIAYHHTDITRTGFDVGAFDAITCLSVIEHGVDVRSYFSEMSRILKPGGVLITSTDYFETTIDATRYTAYGVPVHIFSRDEIVEALTVAAEFGLTLLGTLELSSGEKVVSWKRVHDFEYTFIIFSLGKPLVGESLPRARHDATPGHDPFSR